MGYIIEINFVAILLTSVTFVPLFRTRHIYNENIFGVTTEKESDYNTEITILSKQTKFHIVYY